MSRIIALQACRHGIGCSHLVTNIAVILMQRGYRVGLLDTDPRGGGIRTLLGLDDPLEGTLESYWWLTPNPETPEILMADLRPYTASTDGQEAGIYLPPVGGQFTLNGLQLQVLQQHYNQVYPRDTLQTLSQALKLDYLLIDNQPDMGDDNLMGLSLADVTVVMMQLDTYDFQRTAVMLDIIKQLTTAQIWLVPTLVLPAIEASSVMGKLEHTYHEPVAGVLYLAEEMVRLASGGVFCLHYPTHSLTRAMIAIAHLLEDGSQAYAPTSTCDQSQEKLESVRQGPLFSLLEFPSVERRLLMAVLRHGPIPVDPLIRQSGYSSEDVLMALDHLVQQGWLVHDPITQIVHYRVENLDHQPYD